MSTYLYPPVSVTTLPPAGGATSANQLLELAELQAIKAAVQAGKTIVDNLFFPYVGVSNAGYTELIAVTPDIINEMTYFESGGFPTVLAIGAIGLESDLFMIPPGGLNGQIPINIPAGSRVSIKELVADAISAQAYIVANFYK